MQLHTDKLTYTDMHEAAKVAHVGFLHNEEKGSRTRVRRFNFRLEGHTSNRRANTGQYGALSGDYDGYAATWDEWGIFLNVLFQRDPEAHCGRYSYLGLTHFRYQTGNRFDTLTHADQHINHHWKWWAPHAGQCPCGSIRRTDQMQDLMLVKHGIVDMGDTRSIERWLATKAPAKVPA